MVDEPTEPDDELSELLQASRPGVQVFWISGATKQALADRLAVVLSEHLSDGDDYQLSYNAMQSGWTNHPQQKGGIFGKDRAAHTELFFEYSVIVTIRERPNAGSDGR